MGSDPPKHFLGLRHLLVKHAEMLTRNPANPYAATMNTTFAIITHWMGRTWINRAFSGNTPFRLGTEENIENLKILRFRMLAENLFNLQYVEGFRELVQGQRQNPDLEAFGAELQIGRLLYINDVDFKFVTPSRTAGADYDVEIRIPGHSICAETKCKASSSTLNVKSLTNDIKKAAREQLPKERPGIVFVAMPQNWFDGDDRLAVEAATVSAATAALRSYSRLVSVILYTSTLAHDGTEAFEGVFHKEVLNPKHKFPEFANREFLPVEIRDLWPPKLLRLYDLPYGVLGEYRHEVG